MDTASSAFLIFSGGLLVRIMPATSGHSCSKNAKQDGKQFSLVSVSALFVKLLGVSVQLIMSPLLYR
jgi:hypothetical protein